MVELTDEQITAAKANDITAVTAIIEATEERVRQIAWPHATRVGTHDAALFEELIQVGRVAVWEALTRFEGDTAAQFFAFMNSTVKGKLSDERRRQTRQGVSQSAAARFEMALSLCDGKPFDAEKYVADRAHMHDRAMSPELARAARLSWQGQEPLSMREGEICAGVDGSTRLSFLTSDVGVPDDLIEPRDVISAERRIVVDRVRETLDALPTQQEAALSSYYGIGDYPDFGAADDARGIAAVADVPVGAVESLLEHAHDAFRTAYLGGSVADVTAVTDVVDETGQATPVETKECKSCALSKPLDEFYVRNKATGARMAACKSCKRGATKMFRKDNPEARAAHKRTSRANAKAAAASGGAA
ncbi:sigma factor [Streptomyces anulatus]|uniref:sigma factor n=1 Tax=Streptomyces anulatus TaxID=1892 RepID=UPI0036475256